MYFALIGFGLPPAQLFFVWDSPGGNNRLYIRGLPLKEGKPRRETQTDVCRICTSGVSITAFWPNKGLILGNKVD